MNRFRRLERQVRALEKKEARKYVRREQNNGSILGPGSVDHKYEVSKVLGFEALADAHRYIRNLQVKFTFLHHPDQSLANDKYANASISTCIVRGQMASNDVEGVFAAMQSNDDAALTPQVQRVRFYPVVAYKDKSGVEHVHRMDTGYTVKNIYIPSHYPAPSTDSNREWALYIGYAGEDVSDPGETIWEMSASWQEALEPSGDYTP